MKKLKYMYSLQRSKKQKESHSLPHTLYKHDYIQTFKTQAAQTLYHIEQDYMAKTQLNIDLRNSQIPLKNQYQRRSISRKVSLKKTLALTSSQQQKINKNRKINNENHYEPHNINIKKLMKIKTQSLHQQEHNKLLRNPFYKIQKARQPSLSNNNQTPTPNSCQIPNQLHNNQNTLTSPDNHSNKVLFQANSQKQKLISSTSYNNNQTEQLQLKNEQQFFVSRERKQWYFASKRYRLRTVKNDQEGSRVGVSERIKSKMSESGISNFSKTPQQAHKKQPHTATQHKHRRKYSSPTKTTSPSSKLLQFSNLDSIMYPQHPAIPQESRQQSPNKIRDKSLTLKYQQIKDYFQKKYQRKNRSNFDCSFIQQLNGSDE